MNGDHTVSIGERQNWGGRAPFGISRADRRQHAYIIGKTGTGKSTLLRNMMLQDIEAGEGIGLIDPHGDLAEELLDHIPPSRSRDVLYFDPADSEYPIGFNVLRGTRGETRHLIASAMVSAFKNVWRDSWGPRLEYLLYASFAALAHIENGTMLGVQRMLTDPEYRRWVVNQLDDPIVRLFWEREFASYDKRLLAEVIAPLQNKVGQLVMSPLMRNVLGQVKSRIDPRFIMDRGKIFIANLAKGRLGEDKSNLLGSMLVTAFQVAAMSRSTIPESERRDWYLYVDEFQNFATDSFASILSEARKQRLCLTLAHQYVSQVRKEISDAVFGNVGTVVSFRVSQADARVLAQEFGDTYSAARFTDLGNFEVRVKLLQNGQHGEPVFARTMPAIGVRHGRREQLINRARNSFATPRRKVEDRIQRWMSRP